MNHEQQQIERKKGNIIFCKFFETNPKLIFFFKIDFEQLLKDEKTTNADIIPKGKEDCKEQQETHDSNMISLRDSYLIEMKNYHDGKYNFQGSRTLFLKKLTRNYFVNKVLVFADKVLHSNLK